MLYCGALPLLLFVCPLCFALALLLLRLLLFLLCQQAGGAVFGRIALHCVRKRICGINNILFIHLFPIGRSDMISVLLLLGLQLYRR